MDANRKDASFLEYVELKTNRFFEATKILLNILNSIW